MYMASGGRPCRVAHLRVKPRKGRAGGGALPPRQRGAPSITNPAPGGSAGHRSRLNDSKAPRASASVERVGERHTFRPEAPLTPALGRRAARGAAWIALSFGATQVIAMATNLLL